MRKSINWHEFQGAFQIMSRDDNFSYEGLRALFDHLEQLEEDLGQEFELDVIALCCEYHEIEDDSPEYEQYMGDDAECSDLLIAVLPCSILVREG